MSKTDILAVDVEATCDENHAIAREHMEIIEIGAVLLDGKLAVIDEYRTFIRPVVNPGLTPFCTALTSIGQEDVENAPLAHRALSEFGAWLRSRQPVRWYSWGDYDYRQFKLDCARSGAPWPFPGEHSNARRLYAKMLGKRMRISLFQAVKEQGLKWAGVHHRGIDDARNLARLLQVLLRDSL